MKKENMKEESEFVENLKPGKINAPFVIANKEIRTAKTGNEYIQADLSDKTGQIVTRMFLDGDVQKKFNSIDSSAIYQIWGEVQEFPRGSGKLNIKLMDFKKLDESDYEISDYILITSHDQKKMMEEILTTIKTIKNPYLKELLNMFFEDKKFQEEFMNCPAAKMHHHNYTGGLLEHTLGVLFICRTITMIHTELNPDLLFTAAILHDVGKLDSYDYDMVSIEVSQNGRLIDHIFLGNAMVRSKLADLKRGLLVTKETTDDEIKEFDEMSMQLQHLIISHHGPVMNGWGSPVNPQTPEAVALHHADNLDAKVKGFLEGGK